MESRPSGRLAGGAQTSCPPPRREGIFGGMASLARKERSTLALVPRLSPPPSSTAEATTMWTSLPAPNAPREALSLALPHASPWPTWSTLHDNDHRDNAPSATRARKCGALSHRASAHLAARHPGASHVTLTFQRHSGTLMGMTQSADMLLRALDAIRTKSLSTAGLAGVLGVSWRTAARLISRLRSEGHRILSVREGRSAAYLLEGSGRHGRSRDPLLALAGIASTGLRDGSVNHDHYLYGLPKKRTKR